MKSNKFIKNQNLNFKWSSEDTVCFICPCGEEIILSAGNVEECDCGRTFRLVQFVEMKDINKQ